jgi:hypothetical protein
VHGPSYAKQNARGGWVSEKYIVLWSDDDITSSKDSKIREINKKSDKKKRNHDVDPGMMQQRFAETHSKPAWSWE